MANIPTVPQGGPLNRIRSSVVVQNTPSLNIVAQNMGGGFVTVALQGEAAGLVGTGTGGVATLEPYQMAVVTVDLLRTQPLGSTWFTQMQINSAIGPITVYPDTTAFQPVPLDSCVINNVDLGAWDGKNPVIRLTLHGIFYVNAAAWSLSV